MHYFLFTFKCVFDLINKLFQLKWLEEKNLFE